MRKWKVVFRPWKGNKGAEVAVTISANDSQAAIHSARLMTGVGSTHRVSSVTEVL